MTEHLPQHSAAAFVVTERPAAIAKRLLNDDALIKKKQSCSWVALHVPNAKSQEALEIANHLAPSPNLSNNIKRMLYESLVARLRQYLHDNGIYGTQHEFDSVNRRLLKAQERDRPSLEEISNVLEELIQSEVISPELCAEDIISVLRQTAATAHHTAIVESEDLEDSGNLRTTRIPKPPVIPRKRLCYICRFSLTVPHPTQPSMCIPCGRFNLAASQISAPPSLTLSPHFTALITGSRINLGYYTALRLLRCGARVIATTRYPRDAVARYALESDYHLWKERLRVLGADFRSAADVFALVKETRRCLRDWDGAEQLHLLVNNAAQTLTDSVRKEEQAIEREVGLLNIAEESGIYIPGSYNARVRGGGLLMALGGVDKERGLIESSKSNGYAYQSTDTKTTNHSNGTGKDVAVYTKSSWVQNLFEIPYEDVISAHSVNTFVPLILCRELLPLMGRVRDTQENDERPASTKPEAYIINVSSREGIFEDRTGSAGKAGKHVHTNLSKAALNMITETEAASAWHSRRVAMNTVDPGYMSAAPEYEESFGGQRPLDWEDGAGRVLWPVAVGELEGDAVWGRFLKHYGAVEVDPGAGRG